MPGFGEAGELGPPILFADGLLRGKQIIGKNPGLLEDLPYLLLMLKFVEKL